MADGISIQFETKEVESMIKALLKKVNNPRKLMKTLERWIHAQTMKMFRGRRPDKTSIRGVKWPRLKDSTVKAKKALVKRGKAIVADRPMVRTGELRDDLKTLQSNKRGFEYGTRLKSRKNFPYPGHWNRGKFPWLFLKKQDYAQMALATTDFLKGKLKNFKAYTKG